MCLLSWPVCLHPPSDVHMEMHNQRFGSKVGTIHFIKFATDRMDGFMRMVTDKGLADYSKVVGATGGGSYKFEKDFKEVWCMGHHDMCSVSTMVHPGYSMRKFMELYFNFDIVIL